ncbi:MAG: 4Fe-4S dicluster domain-containing protein [Vicinamibacterales bacterium]
MDLSRRRFFKVAGATGAAVVVARPRGARARTLPRHANGRAMLVDTTRCLGCRACEAACSEANGLPEPAMAGDPAVFNKTRPTDERTFTVVNAFDNPRQPGETRFVKRQCMHCVEPACASACLTKALEKTETGPVVYHKDRCLGCRYCMVACPFEVPKYEYAKANPYVMKCTFCAERQKAGKLPACAEVCPGGALQAGTREELLDVARLRIYQEPDRYVHHIYGEHEVGGTSWLYITDVPFEKLGFDTNLGQNPYSALTQTALSAVPLVITLWPPLLMGLYTFSKRCDEVAGAEDGEERDE